MSFSRTEYRSIKQKVDRLVKNLRPVSQRRPRLLVTHYIHDLSIEITQHDSVFPAVKITYNRPQDRWLIFWLSHTTVWELYEDCPTLDVALDHIRLDAYDCFFTRECRIL